MMTASLIQVDLEPSHAAAGFRLSRLIGWNQAASDWAYLLALGDGVGLETADGDLVASALALPYDRFAWICMVLVAPDYRRQGLATRLMDQVVARQEAQGRVPGLDATPDGREVYRRIGFVDLYELGRYRADAVAAPALREPDVDIQPMTEADLDTIGPVDLRVFGADRMALLHHLRERVQDAALVAWRGSGVSGYVMARDGREASQIGPLVAEDDDAAMALAAAAFEAISGPVYMDVADTRQSFISWIETLGFAKQRPFFRMYRGRDTGFDDPAWLYAIAGPELA